MSEANDLILANMIRRKLETCPNLDVLTFVHVDQGQAIRESIRTYRQLWDNGQRIAAALDDEGMREGEMFALVMHNHPEFVEAMVGSSIANTVFVPIDARSKGERLEYLLEFSECKGAIVADYALDAVLEVLDRLPRLQWIWLLETGLDKALPRNAAVRIRCISDILEDVVPNLEVRVSDLQQPMQLLFTSGTTGNPKAIVAPYARFAGIAGMGEQIGLRSDDRPYTGLSLTHANAQCITLGNALYMGLRTVISRQFTKSRLWDILRRYRCTVFNLLGGMTTAVYSEPRAENDADNPVRYVLSAGMPVAIWADFAKRFDVQIFEFYGTAEGGLTLNPPGVGPVGSIGKPPLMLDCAILDKEGREVVAGQQGEICFRNKGRSDTSPVAYLKNPEASAAKTQGGWFHSGDIGHMDEQGWVYFDYRDGNGIRRNGEFIDPSQVEKVIADSAQVSDVFVYGVPVTSSAPGERELVAAVVPAAGLFEAQQVFAWCRKNLPRNLLPTYLQVVTEIPKTASEKPLERVLLECFEMGTSRVVKEVLTPHAATVLEQ
ncbi:AMP-binding protein, partial [Pseudomonas sp. CrR25]|nr:AMP-binding protein [Pseudomonas sp. CrR25]